MAYRRSSQYGGGNPGPVDLQHGEYITRVSGRSGKYVDQLSFLTLLVFSFLRRL
jgi:hypothetical protein